MAAGQRSCSPHFWAACASGRSRMSSISGAWWCCRCSARWASAASSRHTAVYLSEMIAPQVRNQVLLASQGVTALVARWHQHAGVLLIPSHWQMVPVGQRGHRDGRSCCHCCTGCCRNRRVGWKRTAVRRKPSASWRNWRNAGSAPATHLCRSRIAARTTGRDGRHGAWKRAVQQPALSRPHVGADPRCWLAATPGLIYGVGAFAAVYMVDHGVSAHDVFLTFAVGLRGALSWRFRSMPARRTGGTPRCRAVMATCSLWLGCRLAGAGSGGHRSLLHHRPHVHRVVPVQPVQLHGGRLSRPASASVAFAWTDGLGHLGAWGGVTLTRTALCNGTEPSRLGTVYHSAWRAACRLC